MKDFKESRILQLIAGLAEQWGGADKVREIESTLRSVTNHPDYLRRVANLGDAASENLVTAAVLGLSISASVEELVAGQNPRCFEINGELLAACEKLLAAAKCNYDPQVALHEYGALAEAAIAKAKGAQPQ